MVLPDPWPGSGGFPVSVMQCARADMLAEFRVEAGFPFLPQDMWVRDHPSQDIKVYGEV